MAKAFRTPPPGGGLAGGPDASGGEASAFVTRAREGLAGAEWNVMGQTCLAKQLTETSFAWHATVPPGAGLPLHVHEGQDEFLMVLEGRFDLLIDGRRDYATQLDLVSLPRGVPHAVFNKSGHICKCLCWVSPAGALPDLFRAVHDLPRQSPEALQGLSGRYGVTFPESS